MKGFNLPIFVKQDYPVVAVQIHKGSAKYKGLNCKDLK